ncbi:hypothetical protein EV121DRAFT_251999 [Schizophyllum commune]
MQERQYLGGARPMPRTRVAQWHAIRLVIMVLRLTFLFVRYRRRSTWIFLQDPMPCKSVNASRSSLNAVQTGQLNGAPQSILHVLAADLLRQIPSISASNLVDALETCTERHSWRMSVIAYASLPNTSPTTSQEVGNLKPSAPVAMRSLDQCYAHSPLNDRRVAADTLKIREKFAHGHRGLLGSSAQCSMLNIDRQDAKTNKEV